MSYRDTSFHSGLSARSIVCLALLLATIGLLPASAFAQATCARTVTADVVAIDQPYYLNRLGAFNADGQMYVLRSDTVTKDTLQPCVLADGLPNPACRQLVAAPDLTGAQATPSRNIQLRPDKRPRPIALRMNKGDCIDITYENLVAPQVPIILVPTVPINPFAASPLIPAPAAPAIVQRDDQFVTRANSIHVSGLQLVSSILDDGSFMGANATSLVCPTLGATDGTCVAGPVHYKLYAEFENTFLLRDMANTFGGDGGGGTVTLGLFGGVNVEPTGAEWYRGQATHHEMTLVSVGTHTTGQPVINYDAVYPCDAVHNAEGKCGQPILKMICDAVTAASLVDGSSTKCGPLAIGQIAHTDIDAIITGPNRGLFAAGAHYPSTAVNPRQDRPFREFSSFWNDEQTTVQAFPQFFLDPVLSHTLHPTRDGFMINYAANAIGSEIIANRLSLGPMWDCVDCKAEEFFLTSWAVGDPGMLVDIPANFNNPLLGQPGGPIATTALFPADPSSTHHSYINDHTKFRNIHAGPFEHHIFHLHAHQWVFAPQSDSANYMDMQQIGPGSGFTMDIANGGSGNRQKTPGDAIYHCHFYPHFAQGMWALWRHHEVFEVGTVVEGEVARTVWSLRQGLPVIGARALVDGEVKIDPATGLCTGICRGTPVPFVVPIPLYAMAPMPGGVSVNPADPRRWVFDAADVTAGKTPGFPFYIAGIAGHRPSSPPLDIEFDGGLPRHVINTSQVQNVTAEWVVTRLDLNKELLSIGAVQFPEAGTPVEINTMNFHAMAYPGHPSVTPEGLSAAFEVNGLPAKPGAPFADPCRDSLGQAVVAGGTPRWFDKDLNPAFTLAPPVQFGNGNERHYRVANIQLDMVFNKVGWHHAQNRIISLWDDILPTYNGTRPPEPMVFRTNTLDCVVVHHVNLTPNYYELDDYEIRFPTDIIGQHVHMPKFDVTSADGAANGWNYEDGSLSPGEVHERIHALNVGAGLTQLDGSVNNALVPLAPPQLAGKTPFPVTGARINIQRWFADPVLNNAGVDRGFGNSFTHDHFGPSTFQQFGLYATVLAEPAGSKWYHNETGLQLGTRTNPVTGDGGPTTWQAVILPPGCNPTSINGPACVEAHREFYFEFSDFQSAYERNWDGIIDADSFLFAINPSFRVGIVPNYHSLLQFPGICPSAPGQIVPRPCPEGISVSNPGTYVLNYRSEPIGLRVFNPAALNPFDGGLGFQTAGKNGDLAYAFASRGRAIPDLGMQMASCVRNTPQNPTLIKKPGEGIQFADILGRDAVPVGINHNVGPELLCPQLTNDVGPTDPPTPLMRLHNGDHVKIRAQVGATEETHFFSIHGVKWLQNYADKVSGWRNVQSMGISEQFQFDFPIFNDAGNQGRSADYYYASDTSNEGNWMGTWGLMRSYNSGQRNLMPLPNNVMGNAPIQITNAAQFNGVCPVAAPVKTFNITAVRADEVLPLVTLPSGTTIKTLVYNTRPTVVPDGFGELGGQGPIHDPTAIMYMNTADVIVDRRTRRPIGLVPGTPVEPLVLRANAGDCIKVNLTNLLPTPIDPVTLLPNPSLPQKDLDGFLLYAPVVDRMETALPNAQKITFNANDVAPSTEVGLHAQLLAYDILTSDGNNVGNNPQQTITPGQNITYTWYAGDVRLKNSGVITRNRAQAQLFATPVEFGVVGLMPADKFEQVSKGLVGAMVINPAGTICTVDAGTRAQANCTGPAGAWRDFISVTQTSVNQRFATLDPDPTKRFRAIGSYRGEGGAVPAESQDSGGKAINYKTEPLWFRLAQFPPATPPDLMRNFPQADVYSNSRAGVNGDPQTPVFRAAAGSAVRMHFSEPGGSNRHHGFRIHGHLWQRSPYFAPADFDLDGEIDGPTRVGNNPVSQKIGHQEGYGAAEHFDVLLPSAGGAFRIPGDYYYGMQDPVLIVPGMWGVMRVQ